MEGGRYKKVWGGDPQFNYPRKAGKPKAETRVPNGSEEEKKRERWSFSFLSLILRPFNHNHKSGRDSKVFHAMRLFPSIFVPSVCYPDKVDKYSD